MIEVPQAIVCESCDAVWQRAQLRPREVAHCSNCGAELDRHPGQQERRLLPLSLASLVMFVVSNAFPIVEINLRGMRSQTTLLGAVYALTAEGRTLVATLVLATTIIFPLLQMGVMVWLLLPLVRQRVPRGFAYLVRSLQMLRPWGMVEVFLLGVLVALVKLSGMAKVIPGPALWSFGALTVLLTVVLAFDPRGFWRMASAHGTPGDAGAAA
ncbi:paraquat-inducible protein A [Xylophilus sp. GOD-11R]|uniref:paraquat-inducible protein A n=1 Tax=Xylophilus sp. GOD-11R TaxID=3089814 RepID=UPI00298C5B9F|nr:paraquat-inducible protein A [Xylophilus sp. GOD-11R]WPB58102.1 paraquat-inducible protein A [Xylophilus sp. GOD-11R]